MPSYLRYGDVAAVIGAGNRLAMLGTALDTDVRRQVADLRTRQREIIKGGDSYSTDFLAGYQKPGEDGRARDEAIFGNATRLAEHASKIGPAVVQAATELLYVDALNGAAMLRASNASA
jgi:hypothetical protein